MNIKLKIWRQKNKDSKGHFEEYAMSGIEEHMSFLEVLDLLNEQLFAEGKEPVAFDSDCREGICGQCGVVINGQAHGPIRSTTCQLHMRHLAEDPSFKDGSTITIEPWRSTGFPVLRDLIVDRSALDRIVQAGGYISVNTGAAPDANGTPVPKQDADRAFEAAACIGCGACVAACPNASAMLFTSAKVTHLHLLPQGKPENYRRVVSMLNQMDEEGFGSCTNIGECAAVCPKQIPLDVISTLNRQLGKAALKGV